MDELYEMTCKNIEDIGNMLGFINKNIIANGLYSKALLMHLLGEEIGIKQIEMINEQVEELWKKCKEGNND